MTILYGLGAVFFVVLLLLWILMPFMVSGISKRLDQTNKKLDLVIRHLEYGNRQLERITGAEQSEG